jgi:hypothetical protein
MFLRISIFIEKWSLIDNVDIISKLSKKKILKKFRGIYVP